jgi:predicted TIM-barrel fold metal-dependent hydrolase
VHAAVIAPRHDPRFPVEATGRFPARFARVVMVDHTAPDLDEVVAEARRTAGVVALRQVVADYVGDRGATDLHAGAFDRLFAAAGRHALPVFLLAPGFAGDLVATARAFPDVSFVVDHLGLRQYPPLTMDADPWARLPGLLQLAPYPNVAVKLCGAQLLSAQPYPHPDVWPQLQRVLEAFGTARIMWASDYTRLRMVPAGEPWRSSYAEALGLIRDSALSATEKAAVLGGTLQQWLGWPAAIPAP